MLLSKIKDIFQKNKKNIFYFLLFLISFFSMWDSAFAVEAKKDGGIAKMIVEWFNYIVLFWATIVALLSSLIAMFLEPWAINWTIFWLDVYLKNIWILISNIVYFIFAFILIAIAFMNIIGQWDQKWELKNALPKFVIWVIIVPFSWFFVQFILSISAFLTISVLSLPYDTLNWSEVFEKYENVKICTKHTINLTDSKKDKEKNNESGKWGLLGCDDSEKKSIAEILSWKTWDNTESLWWSFFWIINIYTYGIMNVSELSKLKKNQIKSITKIWELGLKMLFDVIFLIAFLLIMVALFLALFSRVMWLWFHAMFSPLYWLFYFLWKDSWWEEMKKLSVTEFISLAMVPVYVSAALSFWLIFIFVASHGLSKNSEDWWMLTKTKNWTSQINVWGFTLEIKWIVWAANSKAEWWSLFNWGWNAIWQLLLQLFWLAILWIAVMAALEKSTITKMATEPIRRFGWSVWNIITAAPQYMPIIPSGKWNMISASWLQSVWTKINSHYTNIWSEQAVKALEWTIFWASSTRMAKDEKAYNLSKDYKSQRIDTISATREALSWHKDFQTVANSSKLIYAIKAIAADEDLNIDKTIIDSAKVGNQDGVAKLLWNLEKTLERNGNKGDLLGWIKWTNINSEAQLIKAFKNKSNSVSSDKKKDDIKEKTAKVRQESWTTTNNVQVNVWWKNINFNTTWLWDLIKNPNWGNSKVIVKAPENIAKILYNKNKDLINKNKDNLDDLLDEIIPDKEQRENVILILTKLIKKS